MTEHSQEQPQVEIVDVPPDAEIMLGWARRILEGEVAARVSVGAVDPGWNHQRELWLKSYDLYHQHHPENPMPGRLDTQFAGHPFAARSTKTGYYTSGDECQWLVADYGPSFEICGRPAREHRG